MKVLITGAGGQLGCELRRSVPAALTVHAVTREELDIANSRQIELCLREVRPQIIINAAAYTAVDRAEERPNEAYAANAAGPGNLARAAAAAGVRLVHLSTDFVFSGSKSTPYLPSDATEPLSVYGASKLEGERQVLGLAADHALVVRTSWVYSSSGRNFVKTVLQLFEQRSTLDVISDQIGTPTWARGLAEALWEMAPNADLCGLYHWTDAGVASWYDLAVAVLEYGSALGLVRRPVSIRPVRTCDYPLAARRPAMSVLDKTATYAILRRTPVHWRHALKQMLGELVQQDGGRQK
jgi:dTDP-4-dehydrorhamnose reductase